MHAKLRRKKTTNGMQLTFVFLEVEYLYAHVSLDRDLVMTPTVLSCMLILIKKI